LISIGASENDQEGHLELLDAMEDIYLGEAPIDKKESTQ